MMIFIAATAWSERWSEEHNRTYYWDADTGEAAWRRPLGVALSNSLPEVEQHEGWADCTADAAALFNGGALQRAWRSLVRTSHPDKGGSSAAFQSATATRDFLKSPLRYFAHRTLHGESARHRLAAFDAVHETGVLRGARALLGEDSDGWPRLTVEASLAPPMDLGRSHVWRIALAAADASTIEYTGDAGMPSAERTRMASACTDCRAWRAAGAQPPEVVTTCVATLCRARIACYALVTTRWRSWRSCESVQRPRWTLRAASARGTTSGMRTTCSTSAWVTPAARHQTDA
jgi:hypothetical protein